MRVLEGFALDCGYDGPPFIWDEHRRFLMRCELDALFFHLYGLSRDDTAYIMGTVPIVRRKDEQAHGHYRTKDTILEIYDEMAEVIGANAAAVAAGREPTARYQTRLYPPPGPPTDEAGNFIPMAQWDPNHWPSHIHPPRKAKVVVPAPAVDAAEQIEDGVAVLYVLALLRSWNAPVDRRTLDLGMILMQKDALRQRVLNQQQTATDGPTGQVLNIGRMDEFLGELVGTNTLLVEDTATRQLVKLGPAAPAKNQLTANADGHAAFVKADEAVRAVAVLNEQSQSLDLYTGAEDLGAIAIAIS